MNGPYYGTLLLADDGRVALGIGAALVIPVAFARAATPSGLVAGGLFAAWYTHVAGLPGLTAFALLVVGGTIATRVGAKRKQAFGVQQEQGGRRSARQVVANAGPAFASGILVLAIGVHFDDGPIVRLGDAAVAAFFGAVIAAFSDTVAGELGMLVPATPRLLLFGRPTDRGTNGGMTWAGTLFGLLTALSSAIVICIVWRASFVPGILDPRTDAAWGLRFVVATTVGAFAGTVFDSLLGATVERGRWGNEATNFTAATAGGLVAGALSLAMAS